MSRTKRLQAIRKKRGAGLRPGPFEEAYEGWNTGRLRQAEAARVRGRCARRFRRYLSKYEAHGSEGLIDRRLDQASNRCAPVDEVTALTEPYPTRHSGGNVKHFHRGYRRSGGRRSYTGVKKRRQQAKRVAKADQRRVHRKRRARCALPGTMIHREGRTHEWVIEQKGDWILTPDEATREHDSMFFVDGGTEGLA